MSVLINKVVKHARSYTPTTTIKAGQAIDFAGGLAAAGDKMLGVALHDADTTAMDSVMLVGEIEATAAAAITAGDPVEIASNASGVTKYQTVNTGEQVGRALSDAAGDGSKFQLYIALI